MFKAGFVVFLLLVPSIAAVQFDSRAQDNDQFFTKDLECSLMFSHPQIIHDGDDDISIRIDEAHNYFFDGDGYRLPCETKVFTFPLGTRVQSVYIQHSEPQIIPIEYIIENKMITDYQFPYEMAGLTNSDSWFEWKTSGGIHNGEHVLFLTVTCYPVKYSPEKKSLSFIDCFDISVQYEKEITFTEMEDEYDLLILTPSVFEDSLGPLVDHKNAHGFHSLAITLDDIYNDIYFSVDGFDEAEEIKKFLYQAFSQWGVEYVLLVGNINKLPIRETYLGSGVNEMSPLTDLYYADLCFGNGSFCSWDSNNNGVYGEAWHGSNNDLVDLYPDIYIGRLACSTNKEVQTVVEKIITYEENAYGSDWANTFILAGGDTHTGFNNFPEGELLLETIKDLTPELDHIMLRTSDETYTAESLNENINTGAGFVCYAGHGFEIGLSTHPLNSDEWVDYTFLDLFNLRNTGKYPIVVFDACLTARLDYNIANLIADIIYFTSPLPKLDKKDDITFPILFPCIAWEMVRKHDSGAVATIGATRVAYSMMSSDGEVSWGCGRLTQNFFSSLSESTYLSECMVNAQNTYLDETRYDPFTIQEFILLGDPTLRIGGYE